MIDSAMLQKETVSRYGFLSWIVLIVTKLTSAEKENMCAKINCLLCTYVVKQVVKQTVIVLYIIYWASKLYCTFGKRIK